MVLMKHGRQEKRCFLCSPVVSVIMVSVCMVGIWMLIPSAMAPTAQRITTISTSFSVVGNSQPQETSNVDADGLHSSINGNGHVSNDSPGTKNIMIQDEEQLQIIDKQRSNEAESSQNGQDSSGSQNKFNVEDFNSQQAHSTTANVQTKSDETTFHTSTGEVTESKKQNKKKKDHAVDNIEWELMIHKEKGGDSINWKLCNNSASPDYIPCLDNEIAIRQLPTTAHYEHRERHCPHSPPTCLVPLPQGYRKPISWPKSRDMIWYNNVPHTKLADIKKAQNWVRVIGKFINFPGGGTQFKHGATAYINFIQQVVPDIAWGKRSRVLLDVGCGVASFGGYLFEKNVLAMSFAPKDEHEAQVQLALERGIPALSAVMGTQRLPFPSLIFDVVHCARCRVPWHVDGGRLLLELNRVLRPGGYFVWSATPVYQKKKEDVEIWKAMTALTAGICWKLIIKERDKVNGVGVAIYKKPSDNSCYEARKKQEPPLCEENDDPNAAWYVPMRSCLHKIPTDRGERGTEWPLDWPTRLKEPPFWLNNLQSGLYGKQAAIDFISDTQHWKRVVTKSYLSEMDIDWSTVRNVMDMKAVYGGFAAALADKSVWVMNVVPIESPDTLSIIYDRGLLGIYHDWCESFSTYPRTYDLLHADHLFTKLSKRCDLLPVMAEVDRILRPGGSMIIRDKLETLAALHPIIKSLHWRLTFSYSRDQEAIVCARKLMWRPALSE